MPPAPSSLYGGSPSRAGMCPCTLVPVVSVRYRPTLPLELARPSGCRADFEFRSRRAVSQALAARTMILARTSSVLPVAVSTYATAVAAVVAGGPAVVGLREDRQARGDAGDVELVARPLHQALVGTRSGRGK